MSVILPRVPRAIFFKHYRSFLPITHFTTITTTMGQQKPRLKGIVFDMDGTLTVPVIDFQAMYKSVLGEDEYIRLKSKNSSGIDILHIIETWNPDKQKKAYEVIADFERQGLDRLQVMPGASELCGFLDSKNLRRGLITRNVKEGVDLFHQKFGMMFDPALSREFRPYKPDPAPLLHICSAWNVHPNEVMMVGDSLKDDVGCGKRAGAFTCLLDETGRYSPNDFAVTDLKPDFKRSDFSLDKLVLRILERILAGCLSAVFLQVLSWGALALIPVASTALPLIMTCLLISNLGASVTEVAKDALVAEYGQKWKMNSLQSYAFMALAAGGILGNLFGGYFLFKTKDSKTMFLLFSLLLSFQLTMSSRTREESLGLPRPSDHHLIKRSVSENFGEQFSNLFRALSEEKIFFPLYWIVASIAVVPILSGAVFCYQTQCLKLDPSIIGMSKVIGQLMLLSAAVAYDRWWKKIPMRRLIGTVQIAYAFSLLLDLILVKQINIKLGVSNEVFVLCLSALAETIAQFKVLPFSVLFVKLCPRGCEGSLTSFLASALCLSSIFSGFLGVGLASVIGISSGDYSSLSSGIILQFLAALVPLVWIYYVPMHQSVELKVTKDSKIIRSRRRLKKERASGNMPL